MNIFIDLNISKTQKLIFNKPGNYVVFFYNLSGDFIFDIKSSHIALDIYGLFVGKKGDNFNIQTVQRHAGPFSTSNLLIKGVFFDQSKLHYRGLIRIEKNAQKSHAYQKNQNIILSPDSFVESKPYLEILANDVFCTHGSTTGRLNKELLFYASSRGLEKKTAEQMLVDGFIHEIINKVQEKVPDFQFSLPS